MLTAAVCYLAIATAPDYRKNLNTFMEAERAFARSCAMGGIRASFMEWFADEGIGFAPDPVKQKAIAEAVQVRWTQYPTHVFLGQWYQPAALRKNIDGIIVAPVPVFWNMTKSGA